MNAALIAILIMLALSLARIHVIISLLIGCVVGGLMGGLTVGEILKAFNGGISNGAPIALAYILLGAFSIAINRSGLPQTFSNWVTQQLTLTSNMNRLKWGLFGLLIIVSISSQNLIPVHIAFIPILIPPLLYVMAQLKIDRRAIACILSFGLVVPYMFLPIGFGAIFKQILFNNILKSGVSVSDVNMMQAMALPAAGMLIGLMFALLISYRKARTYEVPAKTVASPQKTMNLKELAIPIVAIISAFVVQIYADSMMLGALFGFLLFMVTGSVKWKESDAVFSEGVRLMAMVGFIMITAQGFAEVLQATGKINEMVTTAVGVFEGNKGAAACAMLLAGLLVTTGIGSSFSAVPILAAIYVPLCLQMGFSPSAIVALVGTSCVLGDAGSPASDSALGPTAGLNVDNQHDHIRDTVIPTFLHFNLPLLVGGWIAAMIL